MVVGREVGGGKPFFLCVCVCFSVIRSYIFKNLLISECFHFRNIIRKHRLHVWVINPFYSV